MSSKEPESITTLAEELAALRLQWIDINNHDAEVLVLSEEYKIRWQQVLDLDGEVNRWTASYVIALVVGISWIMGSDRIGDLQQIYSGRNYNNCYFVLSLALINAAYILSLTFKGYQIQQLRLFLYKEICKPLNQLAHTKCKLWEMWHRMEFSERRKGKPEWRRALYYPIVTLLPFAVSVSILGTYFYYAGSTLGLRDPHNIFFYAVIVITMIASVLSISTIHFNKRWEREVKSAEKEGGKKTNKLDEKKQETSYDSTSQVKMLQAKTVHSGNTQLGETRAKKRNNRWVISLIGVSIVAGDLIQAFRNRANQRRK